MNPRAGAVLFLFALLAGAGLCEAAAPPIAPAAPAAPAGPRVLLRLKLEKERTYEVWRRSVRTERRKVGDVEEQTATVLFLACRYTVESVAADGTATVTLTVPRVRAQIYSPAGAVEYDSAGEQEPPAPPPAAAALLAVFAGAELKAKLSPTGEIAILDGAPALLEAALKTVPEGDGREREAALAAVREQFSEATLAQVLSPLSATLPPEAVPVAGTWPSAIGAKGLGLPVRMTGTCQLESHGKGRAAVVIKQTFERDPEATVAGSVSGTGAGRLVLDAGAGWIVKGEMKQDLRTSGTALVGRRHVPATTTISIRTRLGPTAESVAPKPVPSPSPTPKE